METDFKKFRCYHLYRKLKKNHFLVLVQRLDPQTSDGTKIVQYKRRTGTKVGLWYKSRTGTIKRLYWSDLCTGLTIVLVWPLYWSDLCTGLTFVLVWPLYWSDLYTGLTFVLFRRLHVRFVPSDFCWFNICTGTHFMFWW